MIILYLLAIYAVAFAIKEADGPWGICNLLRQKLMQNKYVGVFFYKLLECYFCVGFHAGWIIYLISQSVWHFNLFILWGLAGASFSLIMSAIFNKLSS